MCGIAGIWNTDDKAVDLTDLRSMAHVMAHRGPDDEGFFVSENAGLAFRRLAIIDLSPAGHQPMVSEDGNLAIVFNGEIYNYPELTKTLQQLGYRFRSKSDTEALLYAYAEYGPACVEKLNGMFAFAIVDRSKKIVFAARDRYGMKPFYYTHADGRLLFASEIKSILAVRRSASGVNVHALKEYFTFQNNFGSSTLFQGIEMLPPAHTLTITAKGAITLQQYWEPDFRSNGITNEADAVDQLHDIILRATARHLLSDVPVGSHLSGGLDSASIVALARTRVPEFKTFTAGFGTDQPSDDNILFDERADAENVARHVGTQHYSMLIQDNDLPRILPKVIWHTEDLRVGNSYPSYFVNELASRFVKVAWCGTGGDELFGGYVWRYQNVRDAFGQEDFHQKYYGYWTRLLDTNEQQQLFHAEVWKTMQQRDPYDSYRAVIDRARDLHPIDRALYFEMKTFLHGLLSVEDKMSSAHGLELRVPLLDRELVDFTLGLPHTWKVNHTTGKLIFRKAIERYVSPETMQKRKQGFAAPEVIWFRSSLLPYVHETLLGKESLNKQFMKPEILERYINEHAQGIKNHRLLIWSLLSFEWWLRIFQNNSIEDYNNAFTTKTL